MLQSDNNVVEPRNTDPEGLAELPSTYIEAFRMLRSRTFLNTGTYRTMVGKADRKGAHPQILQFEAAFLKAMQRLQIPMYAAVICVSRDKQLRWLQTGKTTVEPGHSPHNFGRAIVFHHGTLGNNLPDMCWDLVGHVGREVIHQNKLDIEWGRENDENGDPASWLYVGDDEQPEVPMSSAEMRAYSERVYGLGGDPPAET